MSLYAVSGVHDECLGLMHWVMALNMLLRNALKNINLAGRLRWDSLEAAANEFEQS